MRKRKQSIKYWIIIITWFGIFIVSDRLFAQVMPPESKEIKPKVELIGKSLGDSIVLRWAPNLPELWQTGNNFGYMVDRRTVIVDDTFLLPNPEIRILTLKPVKPYSLEQMEPLAMQDNYTAIVAQAIYGESFEVTSDANNDVVSFINQAKEMRNRFSFSLYAADVSVNAAKAHGLFFIDHDVIHGEKYLYRVYIAAPQTIIVADSGLVFIGTSDTTMTVPKPIDLEARWGDRMVELSWNREYFERIFTTYIIERSDDIGKTYKKVSDLSLVNLTPAPGQLPERYYYTDSLPMNDYVYLFRVRGITPFGETSPPSDSVKGMGEAEGPYINPIIVKYNLINNNKVEVIWEVPEENARHIRDFQIDRAEKAGGPYILLTKEKLNSRARSFTDTTPGTVNYYRVHSFDYKGKSYPSFPALIQLPDSIPPAAPVNLQGYIDSSGLVNLAWDKNKETDLEGYRVFMANNPEAEFVKVNRETVLNSKYTDTTILKTLTKYVFYKIAAIDRHYNQSEYSDILKLARPDVVPPAPPYISNIIATDTGTIIEWNPSPADDVLYHMLYRKPVSEKNWELIAKFDSTYKFTRYTDEINKPGQEFEYLLIAVDESGMESHPSNILKISVFNDGISNEVLRLTVVPNYYEKSIDLSWRNSSPNTFRYYIYRQVNDESIQLYRSVEGTGNNFADKQVRKDTVYKYRLQAVYNDGSKSPLSKEITIKF